MATETDLVLTLEAGRVFRVEIPATRKGYRFTAGRAGNITIPIENLVGLEIHVKDEHGKLLCGVKKEDVPKDVGKRYELIIKDYPVDGSSLLIINATLPPEKAQPEVISLSSTPTGSDADSTIIVEAESSVLTPPPEFPFFLANYLKDVEDSITVTEQANDTGNKSAQDNNETSGDYVVVSPTPGSSKGNDTTINHDSSGRNEEGTRRDTGAFTPTPRALVPY